MSIVFRHASWRTLAASVFTCATLVLLSTGLLQGASAGTAECTFEPAGADQAELFVRHLPKSCTQEERERLAIQAGDILKAFVEGKGIDLVGVVVTGNLLLDQLASQPVADADLRSVRLLEALQSQRVTEVRVIRGPMSLRDTQVHGQITTNLKEGFLVVTGPVTAVGTTFERLVDLSHTAFLASVDFSDSIFLREALFVRALFNQSARFERTAFGPHSRFHHARFAGPVTFLRAGFNGLAEFLEVSFEKDASFSRAYFRLGTGFSGSRFHQGLDFSEATFEREAYFLFTRFDGDAYFRRATFRGVADFSDAEFKGLEDFSKVYFDVPPKFRGTKGSSEQRSLGGLQNPKILLAIIASLVVFTLVFLLILRKM